jgi:hypothetical protein
MAPRTIDLEKLLAAQEALQAAVDALANALPVPAPDEVRHTQFTLTIVPNVLHRVDAVARRKGISRAALLSLWICERLEQEAA